MICVLESRVYSECVRVNCLSRIVTDYNPLFLLLLLLLLFVAILQYLDWDSGKAHIYHCHVDPDGSYRFKV
jgi:hypothetical protein